MHIDESSKKMEDFQKCKSRALRWDKLARVNEGLALLEAEKEVHSAALAWLIKEPQNVLDAKVWAYAQRAFLERTIRAKARERQELAHCF